MAAGAARIRVSFQVDADGLLSVSAQELSQGVEASITVKPSYGLADEDIARMLQDAFGAAQSDMRARALREQQVEADRMLEATQVALDADADLLDEMERDQVQRLMRELRQASASSTDPQTLEAAVQRLARGTETFAARRMDRAIQQALTGRHIDKMD
jgi:molecular chaperone HscA